MTTDAQVVADALRGSDTQPWQRIPAVVVWRCPKGHAVARAWWIDGRVLLVAHHQRFGQVLPEAAREYAESMGADTTVPTKPRRDVASWWTGAETLPTEVRFWCRHGGDGWSVGSPSDLVSVAAAQAMTKTAANIVLGD